LYLRYNFIIAATIAILGAISPRPKAITLLCNTFLGKLLPNLSLFNIGFSHVLFNLFSYSLLNSNILHLKYSFIMK